MTPKIQSIWEEFDKKFGIYIYLQSPDFQSYTTCGETIKQFFRSHFQSIIQELEKLPKYDLSKNGISGEYYIKREEAIEVIKKRI